MSMNHFLTSSTIGPPVVVSGITVLIVYLVWKVLYNVFLHPLAAVPGPFFARVFNSYMTPSQARLHRALTLAQLHKTYGSVVRIAPNEVSIADWTKYREIYGPKGGTKAEHFYGQASFLGHENIFSMRNKAQHSARRKLESRPYSHQAVAENEALIADKAEVLVRRIAKRADDAGYGQSTDVYPLCGLFSLEVILKCTFNRSYGEDPAGESSIMLKAMDESAGTLPIDATFPFIKKYGIGRYFPGAIGHLYRQFDLWIELTRNLVNDFRQQEISLDKTQRFMITPLLLSQDTFLGRQMTDDEIVEEAMGIAFAGSGTTSTTLTYCLYSLARYPAIQAELRAELLRAPSGNLLSIQDLPFLNSVIKETMRLYPTIISTLPRVLDQPLNINDFSLPRGTFVGMQNYVHHRDADLFPEPDAFLPNRWMQASKDMQSALTPFSVGPRNCIGQNLAWAELYLAISKIVIQLELSLDTTFREDDMEMEDRFNVAPKGRRLVLQVRALRTGPVDSRRVSQAG